MHFQSDIRVESQRAKLAIKRWIRWRVLFLHVRVQDISFRGHVLAKSALKHGRGFVGGIFVIVIIVIVVVVLIFQSGVDGGGYVGVMKGGHVSVDVGEGNDGSTKTTFVRGYQHLLDHGVFQLVVAEEREWIKNWAGTG